MERFKGGVAVVTGSSSGIGEAVSEALVQRGLVVVGLARRMDRLQALSDKLSIDLKTYPGKFYAYKCDVSQENEIRETFAAIKKHLGPISILVNNAAIIVKTDTELLKVNGSDFDVTFSTNVKGSLISAQEAINSMMENGIEGHIVNVNSLASTPGFKIEICNLYGAAKNSLRVLSDSLRQEILRSTTKIKVTNIYPGGVKTEIMRDFDFGEITYDPHLQLLPEDVAKHIISVLDTPAAVLVSDLTIVPLIHHY